MADALPVQVMDFAFVQSTSVALVIVFALVGAAWGLAADRIAARWPAHADGSVRGPGWRTAVAVAMGGVAAAALPVRFTEAGHLLLFGGYFAALTLLLATDLDQRLLPDVITLPLIPVTLVIAVAGLNPLVAGHLLSAGLAAVVIPAILFGVSIPFGAGALGLGDVKLAGAAGAWLDWTALPFAVELSALCALAFVLVGRLVSRRRFDVADKLPFGAFFAPAIWVAWLVAHWRF